MERTRALDRVTEILDAVTSGPTPVPVRELWVYGDVALGLDPVERLDVYVTKDLLFGGDADREEEFRKSHGVKGVGKSVSAEWAEEYPEHLRANANGHAAPEKCLAAHLLEEDEPVHLEVCNASFEDNVTQRLKGAVARDAYEQILDPRGVCLYADGRRSEDALEKLRGGELVFPTLSESLEMLGLDEDEAEEAAAAVQDYRLSQSGATVRGDVV
ncbi:DUF7095 family protein [Halopelagius longus]|uniref:Uncharacterized protein n=1 Tax=Halopelagius longus TaxID=1236180 RepID=A0A1H1DK89_9EURY|nr:hypothetical protein [Halopelagius longus]RDI71365.1 hypothetical protein DWB78_06275 [Halopelagius longus]SDQ76837.1 hypothetical protein SAMN05216278_2453 [Halopelagius longus]